MNRQDFQADLDRLYEQEKAAWIAANPGATSKEYEQAMRAIAERLGY